MSVFIIQYMQIRAYIKRILRYSYWCKNAEISFYDEESLLKRWNRNRLMKHSSAVTCFFLPFSFFPWCPVEYWYSFGKLGHQIIKLCIESINTLKINTIFAARIPCLLSTLLRNGDMWIYMIEDGGKININECNILYFKTSLKAYHSDEMYMEA